MPENPKWLTMRTELGTSFKLELFLLYVAQLARPRGDSEATLWATLPRLLQRLLLLLFTIKVCLAATCVANSLRALAADTERVRGRGGPLVLSICMLLQHRLAFQVLGAAATISILQLIA